MLQIGADDSGDLTAAKRTVQRIILTGFRATGKSAVGRKLAALLGCRFVDTDTELVAEMGCSLSEYVRRSGWAAFRELERQLLLRLAGEENLVVATGGGSVLHREEWAGLRRNSLTVWLQADAETIRQRLNNDSTTDTTRPPLTDSGTQEEVGKLLAEREPIYRESSDMAVDTAVNTPEEIATLIRDRISHY